MYNSPKGLQKPGSQYNVNVTLRQEVIQILMGLSQRLNQALGHLPATHRDRYTLLFSSVDSYLEAFSHIPADLPFYLEYVGGQKRNPMHHNWPPLRIIYFR